MVTRFDQFVQTLDLTHFVTPTFGVTVSLTHRHAKYPLNRMYDV